jgi:hypothetical protein
MPWGSESVEANIGPIVLVSFSAVVYLTMIASFIYRKFHPGTTPRVIQSDEVGQRLSKLIAMGLPENIADPVARGEKINAIKAYRETYGVRLKYGKDAVESWESALRAVEQASQSDS